MSIETQTIVGSLAQIVFAGLMSLLPAWIARRRGLRKLASSIVLLCCLAGAFLGWLPAAGLAVVLAFVAGLADKAWLSSAGEGRPPDPKQATRDVWIGVSFACLITVVLLVIAYRSGLL